ncbi:hypothetical protein AWH49_13520 [Domibacillus aminovorans]|uniref:SLH domain-containing protein n=2 Tax=Domibacillus aminovorans TaxID=29332 RepID=A0A177L779_9BACI|nr:hypothetical protein AWH49_13520 [Domibacillus aminovorans]
MYILVVVFMCSGFTNVHVSTFSDIPAKHRLYDKIIYLVNKGVVSGGSNGTFKAEGIVTRAEAAIMIGRSLQLDGGRTSTVFTDVKAAHGASGYTQSAFESGIIQGFPDGSFKPNEKVTRGQMAIFLSRAFDLTEESAI